jgi:hypothetical protein
VAKKSEDENSSSPSSSQEVQETQQEKVINETLNNAPSTPSRRRGRAKPAVAEGSAEESAVEESAAVEKISSKSARRDRSKSAVTEESAEEESSTVKETSLKPARRGRKAVEPKQEKEISFKKAEDGITVNLQIDDVKVAAASEQRTLNEQTAQSNDNSDSVKDTEETPQQDG